MVDWRDIDGLAELDLILVRVHTVWLHPTLINHEEFNQCFLRFIFMMVGVVRELVAIIFLLLLLYIKKCTN